MNYNCTVPTCYPAYRTSYDRMMQRGSCQFCQPSEMLQCNKAGNPQVVPDEWKEGYQPHKKYWAKGEEEARARTQAQAQTREPQQQSLLHGVVSASKCGARELGKQLGELDKQRRHLDDSRFENARARAKGVTDRHAMMLAKARFKEGAKVIILSGDSFCGYCKKLLKEIPLLKQLLGSKGVEVEVVSDTDNKEKFHSAAKMAQAKGFPHAVVLDSSSNKIGEVSGYMPADEYAQAVLSKLSSTT
jgi:hypothetical protein